MLDGNDRIVDGLTSGAAAGASSSACSSSRVRTTAAGAIELTFNGRHADARQRRTTRWCSRFRSPCCATSSWTRASACRRGKTHAIASLGYGTNAKMMVGFSSRPWAALGSNGGVVLGSAEPSRPRGRPIRRARRRRRARAHGLLGRRARRDRSIRVAARSRPSAFLPTSTASTRARRRPPRAPAASSLAHLEHWPSNPLTLGSYTCYRPGQFTTIAGLEGKPAGNLYFAGEHANSFYEWQGFMEGAALSGIQAAADIARAMKRARVSPLGA